MVPSEETRLRLLSKFRVETAQNLTTLRNQLPKLYQPENQDVIITMFFAAHTIKGSLGMMQLLEETEQTVSMPATHLEALLLSLRNREIVADPSIIETIESYLAQLESQFLQNK